jgi:hypothetical protein
VKQCVVMAENSLDTELRAMQEIATILHGLDQPTRARVLRWIVERFQTDVAFGVTGAPATPPSVGTALRGVPLASDPHDDTLSVDRLDEFFEGDEPQAPPQSSEREAHRVTGLAPESAVSQDLADFWNEPERGPAAKPAPRPIFTIAS